MIEVGMIVKLADGTIGEVVKTTVINGGLFHSIRVLIESDWGLCRTFQRTFAVDSEIVAIRKTANVALASSAA